MTECTHKIRPSKDEYTDGDIAIMNKAIERFTVDIVEYVKATTELGPERLGQLLNILINVTGNAIFYEMRRHIKREGWEEVADLFTGDVGHWFKETFVKFDEEHAEQAECA